MNYDENVNAIDEESRGFIEAVAAGPLDVKIPSCPAWTMRDLAEHTGTFLGWWTHVVCEGSGREKPEEAPVPEPDRIVEWLGRLADSMVEVFSSTPPDQEIWTWAEDKSAAFAATRAANELGIHRYDAQLGRSTQQPLGRDLAASIIDEIETIVQVNGDLAPTNGETIHLHATDGDGEWILEMHEHGFHLRHEHAKGDLALRGAVSDLALKLYGRPTIGAVEELGDASALAMWEQIWPWK